MLSSTSEQPRRLNLKIAYALFVVVQQTVTKLLHYLLIGFFQSLKWKPVKHGGPITSLINLVYAKKEKKKSFFTFGEEEGEKKEDFDSPASPLCSYFSWPPPWLCACYGALQSHTCQDLGSVAAPLLSFPDEDEDDEDQVCIICLTH